MTNQWPGAPSPQWTTTASGPSAGETARERPRQSSVHSHLHPLDTSMSNLNARRGTLDTASTRSGQSEQLPSVSELLGTTPVQGSSGDPLSGSAHGKRWESMLQSPVSDRSSAISGCAPISDILSARPQASPRNPYAAFHNSSQFLPSTAEMDRRQSAPVHQRSPAHHSVGLSPMHFPTPLKREATPMDPAQKAPPIFRNPFPDAGGRNRTSNSVSPQYTPSPQTQPNVLQPSMLSGNGSHSDSSRSWSHAETQPNRTYSHPQPGPQGMSQSVFGNAEFIDTSQPGPLIQVDGRFYPRFLREEYLPDEGLCYFYDDGRHCKAVINGEHVHPHWGITRAGKPRKRLFLACESCRLKKIKCKHDYPKCEQCKKFGRECRFTEVPRGTQASALPTSQPVSPEQMPPARLSSALRSTKSSSHPSPQEPSPHQTSWLDPPSPKSAPPVPAPISTGTAHPPLSSAPTADTPTSRDPPPISSAPDFSAFKIPTSAADHMPVINEKRRASFEIDREELLPGTPLPKGVAGQPPAKRRRTSSRVTLDFEIQESREHHSGTRDGSDSSNQMPVSVTPTRQFTWQTNPLDVDSEMVLDLMDLYFKYFNPSSYCLFPCRPFLAWFKSTTKKSLDDLMLIYAILAMATRFTSSPKAISAGGEFESIAKNAVESNQGKFSMQLIQARILLGLHASAADNARGAWDYIGAAIHAAMGARLFLEEGRADLGDDYIEFGLSKSAMGEVCRRTFWTLYIMDRFNGYVSGSTSSIVDEDVGLRLPCCEDDFEAQNVTEMPYFEPDFADSPNQPVITSPMGCLVNIVSLWGQYLANICRSARRNDGSFARKYEQMYANMLRKLAAWQNRLPPYFQDTNDSMMREFEAGHLGTYATIQFVYRTIHIKLNCLAPQECMSHGRVVENLRRARLHATGLLEFCDRSNQLLETRPFGAFNISTSFAGYAITTACNVIAARGLKTRFSEALQLLKAGSTCLSNVKGRWRSCEKYQVDVNNRIQTLKLTMNDVSAHDFSKPMLSGVSNTGISQQLFRSTLPSMKTFAPVDDLAYTAGDDAFLEALVGVKTEPVQARSEHRSLGPMLMF